jgi:hypothetical protein
MPFERLMEHVAALSDEDEALPLGVLSGRWGEPAARIMDAIDAVRVMRGERTYVTVTEPATRPPSGELCGCRCKNPKGQCGCCDESLIDWYASMEGVGTDEGRGDGRDRT